MGKSGDSKTLYSILSGNALRDYHTFDVKLPITSRNSVS